jgi:hypothetical protein
MQSWFYHHDAQMAMIWAMIWAIMWGNHVA